MDGLAEASRSLPAYALIPALLLSAVLLAIAFARTPSQAGRFVIFAVWLRYVLSAVHEFSFARSPVGLSWNALASISIAALGLFLVRRRRILDPGLVPFYPLFGIMLISGILNHQVALMATALTKYAYLVILILATEDAIQNLGADRFFKHLLYPAFVPFLLQALSVVLHVVKAGERDGSASYIGGYYHEAAFSVALTVAIISVCFIQRMSQRLKLMLIAVGFMGILLANYRTAILAILPFVGVALLHDTVRRFVPSQRTLVGGAMAILIVAAATAGAIKGADRFSDLRTVAMESGSLIKRTETFSVEERQVLSGRVYIWSDYIYAWKDAGPARKLIGFGPESWTLAFSFYAHNTLVSALYEIGVLGVGAILLLWFWMIGLALAARGAPRLKLVAAHGSFLVLNMATMPFWMIEGMIIYGVLCGYTIHCYRNSASATRRSPLPIPADAAKIIPV